MGKKYILGPLSVLALGGCPVFSCPALDYQLATRSWGCALPQDLQSLDPSGHGDRWQEVKQGLTQLWLLPTHFAYHNCHSPPFPATSPCSIPQAGAGAAASAQGTWLKQLWYLHGTQQMLEPSCALSWGRSLSSATQIQPTAQNEFDTSSR